LLAQQAGALEAAVERVGIAFQRPVELFEAWIISDSRAMAANAWPSCDPSLAANQCTSNDNEAKGH
jgi:hypothetical protein